MIKIGRSDYWLPLVNLRHPHCSDFKTSVWHRPFKKPMNITTLMTLRQTLSRPNGMNAILYSQLLQPRTGQSEAFPGPYGLVCFQRRPDELR